MEDARATLMYEDEEESLHLQYLDQASLHRVLVEGAWWQQQTIDRLLDGLHASPCEPESAPSPSYHMQHQDEYSPRTKKQRTEPQEVIIVEGREAFSTSTTRSHPRAEQLPSTLNRDMTGLPGDDDTHWDPKSGITNEGSCSRQRAARGGGRPPMRFLSAQLQTLADTTQRVYLRSSSPIGPTSETGRLMPRESATAIHDRASESSSTLRDLLTEDEALSVLSFLPHFYSSQL